MQSPVNSAWFSEKEAEVTAHPKRGRKRSVVDKERRELAKKVLLVAHDRLESWERVAQFYGLSKAAAYRIAKDNAYRPSKAMLNSIIETDIPMVRQIPVAPCPSCAARGIVRSHGDKLDCNGNGGTAVVLADGETVRKPRKPRQYTRIADMPVAMLARAIRDRYDVSL